MVKGYIYTLESIIAISIILIAIVVIISSYKTSPPLSAAIVKRQGIEALEFLDDKDSLRKFVLTGDIQSIKNQIRSLLPPGINLDASICEYECKISIPNQFSVVIVDYYISGYRESFFNKKIRLWMWGEFS